MPKHSKMLYLLLGQQGMEQVNSMYNTYKRSPHSKEYNLHNFDKTMTTLIVELRNAFEAEHKWPGNTYNAHVLSAITHEHLVISVAGYKLLLYITFCGKIGSPWYITVVDKVLWAWDAYLTDCEKVVPHYISWVTDYEMERTKEYDRWWQDHLEMRCATRQCTNNAAVLDVAAPYIQEALEEMEINWCRHCDDTSETLSLHKEYCRAFK